MTCDFDTQGFSTKFVSNFSEIHKRFDISDDFNGARDVALTRNVATAATAETTKWFCLASDGFAVLC